MAGDAHCENWGNNSDFFLMVCSGAWAGVMGTPRLMTHSAVATRPAPPAAITCLLSVICACAWIQISVYITPSTYIYTVYTHSQSEMRHWHPGPGREQSGVRCRHLFVQLVGLRFSWRQYCEFDSPGIINACKNYGHDSDYECTLRNKKSRYCFTAAHSCMLKVKVIFMPY